MNKLPNNTGPTADPVLTGVVIARYTPPTTNPLAKFFAKYQGGSNGVQVDIQLGVALNALSIKLWRGFSRDPAQAKAVQTWTGPFSAQDQLEYADIAPAVLAATKVYYWAQIVYEQTPSLTQQQFGPQTAFVNAVAGGSEQIPAFSVSVTPGTGVLNVAVSFEFPSAPDFGSAQVYASNYNKIAAPQLIAEGAESPFSFTMNATGEVVTIQLNSVSVSGAMTAGGPTATIQLNAAATLPAIIFNGVSISNTIGNQITFPGPAESDVTQMKVYRQNAGGTFAGATLIATIAPSTEKSYTVTDKVANPANFIYFVTAVNQVGESLPSPAITPGQPSSQASQGSGATAAVYMVTTTVPGIGSGLTFVAQAPVIAQGVNYYAQPLATFSPSSASGGRSAQGTPVLDGAGHVINIQMTDGGVYATGDIDSATVTIGY